jgi:hypothetical protein
LSDGILDGFNFRRGDEDLQPWTPGVVGRAWLIVPENLRSIAQQAGRMGSFTSPRTTSV